LVKSLADGLEDESKSESTTNEIANPEDDLSTPSTTNETDSQEDDDSESESSGIGCLIAIMVAMGFFGGAVNYCLRVTSDEPTLGELGIGDDSNIMPEEGTEEEKEKAEAAEKKKQPWRLGLYIGMGLGASFLTPLFLHSISSDLVVKILAGEGGDKLLVFMGYCLLAAIMSRTFIGSMARSLRTALHQARLAKKDADEAKKNAKTLTDMLTDEEDDPSTSSGTPLGDLPSEGDSEGQQATQSGAATFVADEEEEVAVDDAGVRPLRVPGAPIPATTTASAGSSTPTPVSLHTRILISMATSNKLFRTAGAISRDVDEPITDQHLTELAQLGYVAKRDVPGIGDRWCITAAGRAAARV
jgi:hypothetical protein